MANRWGNNDRLYFLGLQNHCRQWLQPEIKRRLLLAMTNLASILKSRDITLQTQVLLVKAMVFPAVMCGCESWTIKKAECQRIDAFELWCQRRLLGTSWIVWRSKQSIFPLKGLMLKLKLQYFGYLMWKANSLEKTDAGKDWRQKKKGAAEDETVR